MKILVTGGSGFIGSNFIHYQINNGNTILNLDNLTYASTLDSLSSLNKNPNYIFIKGDVSSYNDVKMALKSFCPDKIVHFAAESHVDRSIDGPDAFIKTNIIGTYTLLNESLKYYEGMSEAGKKLFRFLHVSTDEVFGSLGESGFFKEDTAYDPSSPYSASKAASDHLVMAWCRTYKLPVLITNCSNNYGPYQFPEKLIPLMIINAINNKKLPIYGSGENIRDWLYVSDHCRAIDMALKNGKIGESYLIGGNAEKSNIEVVKTICNILNELKPKKNFDYNNLIEFVEDRPGHDYRYAIDFSKINLQLDWSPEIDFENGIRQTIDWYIDNESWWHKIYKKKYNQNRLGIYK